jgi:hypothetical protein
MSPTEKARAVSPGPAKAKPPAARPALGPAPKDWMSPAIGGAALLVAGLALFLRRPHKDGLEFSRNPFPADRRGWAVYFFRGKKGKLTDK